MGDWWLPLPQWAAIDGGWLIEDFASPGNLSGFVEDPWEPVTRSTISIEPTSKNGLQTLGDFWDPLGPPVLPSTASSITSEAWFDNVALPLFTPKAAENPFQLKNGFSPERRLSQNRARWLLSLLDVPNKSAHRKYLRAFEELFENFSHPNTFRTLTDLALDDVSADDFLTAFQLRSVWAQLPKCWSIHIKGTRGPVIPANGDKMLGWTRAVHLAVLAKGIPAECIIDEDWYYEWLEVPFGDSTYWSFLEYATARLEAFSNGVLELPTELRRIETRTHRATDVSIDGIRLGSAARAGHLVRLETDAWALRALGANSDVLSPTKV